MMTMMGDGEPSRHIDSQVAVYQDVTMQVRCTLQFGGQVRAVCWIRWSRGQNVDVTNRMFIVEPIPLRHAFSNEELFASDASHQILTVDKLKQVGDRILCLHLFNLVEEGLRTLLLSGRVGSSCECDVTSRR